MSSHRNLDVDLHKSARHLYVNSEILLFSRQLRIFGQLVLKGEVPTNVIALRTSVITKTNVHVQFFTRVHSGVQGNELYFNFSFLAFYHFGMLRSTSLRCCPSYSSLNVFHLFCHWIVPTFASLKCCPEVYWPLLFSP